MTPERLAVAFDEVERAQLLQAFIARKTWEARLLGAHVVNELGKAMSSKKKPVTWVTPEQQLRDAGMVLE